MSLAAAILAGLASVLRAGSVDPAECTGRAEACLARADTSAAIGLLEQSHLDDHADPRASLLLGRILRETGTIEARLRSQRVLERARSRFPDNADVCMELGRTYFAQRFFPDAVGCFERVLEIDPARCDAPWMIGLYHYRNWKRVNEFHDDLVTAKNWLRSAWTCDSTNAEATALYLYARYVLKNPSVSEADQALARFPDRAAFHLYRGVLAYDAGRFEACARHFDDGLELLPAKQREVYDDLASVLPASEFGRYLDAPVQESAKLRRGYWLAADPDPTTAVNERRLEHVYRVFLADVLFSSEWIGQRGWETDRGQAFVKFGRPDHVEYTLGESIQNGYEETWSYVLGGVFQQFLFVDEFLNGNPRIPYRADLLVHFLIHEPEFTDLRSRVAPVPAEIDVIAFRDDDLNGSLYVAMRVNADTLDARADPASTNRYVIRGAYFDGDWHRDGGAVDTVWTSDVPRRVASGSQVLEFVRRVPVPFDDYHVAWTLEDEGVRARASGRAEAELARFAQDRLSLSGVLFFDGEGGADSSAVVVHAMTGLIDRGEGGMRPRIGHAYGPGEPLRTYLEVYHLTVVDGASDYDVRYSIYPAVRDDSPAWLDWLRAAGRVLGLLDTEPVIAQSFARQGTVHTERERITIDIGALAPGDYELLVEVTDRNSGEQATTRAPLTREEARVADRNAR